MKTAMFISEGDRRDSGYSPAKEDLVAQTSPKGCSTRDSIEVNTGDSGVGSPSPLSPPRSWGRRWSRRSELRNLRDIRAALQDLSNMFGGEVVFSYTPRTHPNLPSLDLQQARFVIPGKKVDRTGAPSCQRIEPGHFLNRTGLSESDILDRRLPDMPSGGLAVVSNGLALDLLAISDSDPELGPSIVKYVFHFLELRFPARLLATAVAKTLECLAENREYVQGCENITEANSFLFAPFVVPEDVAEMAEILEDEEEAEGGEEYCHTTTTGPMSYNSLLTTLPTEQNNIVNIVNNGQLETFEISSIANLAPDTGGVADILQDDYSIIHSEDENFAVTAITIGGCEPHPEVVTVFEDETQSPQPQAGGEQSSCELKPEQQDDCLAEFAACSEIAEQPQAPTSPVVKAESLSDSRKRSRTRQVQIPSRFKDFTTETPTKKSK